MLAVLVPIGWALALHGCDGKHAPSVIGAGAVATFAPGELTSPGAHYVEVRSTGQLVAFMDATCGVWPGDALSHDLPCIRPEEECDSEAQRDVNRRLHAERVLVSVTGKTSARLCRDATKAIAKSPKR